MDEGKTKKYDISILKNGAEDRQKFHMQIYNRGYDNNIEDYLELNMYVR